MQNRKPLSRLLLAFALLTLLCAGIFAPHVEKVGAAPLNANALDVVINEIAWGGTVASTSDEWIELYNPTGSSINITGWTLIATSGTPNITLSGTIPANGFFLLERTDDTATSVTMDQFFTGAIANNPTGDSFTLRDQLSNIIDTANINGGPWPGGSVGPTFSTMERVSIGVDSDSNWGSNNGTTINGTDLLSNAINGTPKQQNSIYALPTSTPTITFTPTVTITPSLTFTPSETFTPSLTFTPSQTNTSTPTGSATVTPTITNTSTPTGSATVTRTITSTATITPTPSNLSVLINEVAWAGTSSARTGDEWIELYNTESFERNLNGWKLTIDDSSDQSNETTLVTFSATDKISPGNFFILARSTSGNYDIFTNVVEDKEFTTAIPNTGVIILRLYTAQNVLIDTANSGKNSGWYAGTASSTYNSMERKSGKPLDSASAWQTFAGTPFALNRDGTSVRGTPKRSNSVITSTSTPVATRTRTRVPTVVPVGRPIINEFLPRPGFDWNQDGKVNVFDEFIEVKNIGPVDINIGGWRLDDEENLGSNPFTLPSVTLKPGERIVFYGLETNILLSDGGDTVRLLNPSNKVYDSYTYKIAKFEDKSVCRLPDGNGSWYEDCLPTPMFTNSREGKVPSMPDGEAFESPVCDLPDTLPEAFLIAECRGYGTNLWRTMYWDADGWGSDVFVPENTSKWESFVE